MSAIILAGGRSSRLGQDKSSLVLAGENLLRRIVDSLSQLESEIILVLAQGQETPPLPASPNIKIATDLHSGKGALIGIFSGLMASNDEYSLVVACDMPFLNAELLHYMIGLAPGFDAVFPRIGKFIEPLHAVYSRNCLKIIENMIKNGNLKISSMLEQVKVRYVGKSEIDKFDPEHMSLFNINKPADMARAEQIITNLQFQTPISAPGNRNVREGINDLR